MSQPALELIGLSKRFAPDRPVLQGVSMRLEAGERVALLGESGVGKSTLLNLIAGLDRPDEGTIRLGGKPMHTLDEPAAARLRAREIGFVFQAFHLIAHLKVWQNVAIALLLNGVPVQQARERAQQLLEQVGLGTRGLSLPRELSGGEQQRVALARAVVHRPRLILADEPTGNLDPATGQGIMALLDALNRTGTTVVMATHDHRVVNAMRRRVIQLDRGVIVRDQERGVYE